VKPQPITTPLALWLDPDTALTEGYALLLEEAGWTVLTVSTPEGVAHHAAHAQAVIVRLSDDTTRLHAVDKVLRDTGVQLPVICRVDRQDLDLAVQATQEGAAAVVAIQESRHEAWTKLRDKLQSPTQTVSSTAAVRQVVFVDPISQHLLALAQKVAQADVTALLVGPTGAGKEVLARVLHDASTRAHGPFVALNCAAIPENLIEDMLFGHEKGAFTGAHRDHKGVFEQAQGGTLFLDEIGEMPMHLQSKLLRVLQDKQLTRLGGQTVIPLNVRFVAATNKDLRKAIAEREFREDLYYRIATFRLTLQPLCERPGDILPLAMQCLLQHSSTGKPWFIHPQAQEQLLQYPWPGNVRELENVMRRAVVLCPDQVLTPAHLMFDEALPGMADSAYSAHPTLAPAPERPTAFVALPLPLMPNAPQTLPPQPVMPSAMATPAPAAAPDEASTALPADLHSANRINEHQVIMATLASTPSKTEAAKRLGISPRTLRYKLAQLREMGLGLATVN
jgi:two-component system response regulator FlrC